MPAPGTAPAPIHMRISPAATVPASTSTGLALGAATSGWRRVSMRTVEVELTENSVIVEATATAVDVDTFDVYSIYYYLQAAQITPEHREVEPDELRRGSEA